MLLPADPGRDLSHISWSSSYGRPLTPAPHPLHLTPTPCPRPRLLTTPTDPCSQRAARIYLDDPSAFIGAIRLEDFRTDPVAAVRRIVMLAYGPSAAASCDGDAVLQVPQTEKPHQHTYEVENASLVFSAPKTAAILNIVAPEMAAFDYAME